MAKIRENTNKQVEILGKSPQRTANEQNYQLENLKLFYQ